MNTALLIINVQEGLFSPFPQSYQSKHWQLGHSLDSFLRTKLQILLQKLNIIQRVVCGYASEFCVNTTIRQATAFDYPIILTKDVHTTHDKPHVKAEHIITHHTYTLPDLTSFGVSITALASQDIQF